MHSATHVRGKFLEVDGRRFLIKGVTYGTFAPDAAGQQFPELARVDRDFAMMAAAGINTVRVYTPPSPAILDAAARHGLRMMIGIPWSQHIAFLDDAALTARIRADVADTVARLAVHPAALLFSVGNEIPPGVVRWHGQKRVERFLRDLADAAKARAPEALLTYVNFPPTEFLDLAGFDVCAFNVYLHREADLRAYLARLQHLAGQRPLLLAEAGADSIREGLDGQARLTAAQLRTAYAEGAAGAVAFAWTDEWWRGGQTVDDWKFGLVDADRAPKPALAAVTAAFAEAPFAAAAQAAWPSVSVVVCAYNAADTIADCLTSLQTLTYPHADVIVVDDGSKDETAAIVARYPGVRLITIPNGGLSAARNVGLEHATGEIVAYTDADVRVDPDWLTYLVQPFLTSNVVGSGGPNVVPADDGVVAQCVARAPGGPTHVLLDDRIAEHVPGCNMAFRRDALVAVGGFNPVYLRAGDDVDICWRLQAKGQTIGFAPSALVWHHHRSSIKAYWRQQAGYGEGESWLDAHHPEKFLSGQMLWRGRIYSPLPFVRALTGRRINTGVWGTAAFPSVYSVDCHPLQFLPHSPAWMITSTLLALGGALWLATRPGDAAWLLLLAGALGWATTIGRCVTFARRSDLAGLPAIGRTSPPVSRLLYRALIAWLHLLQPVARMTGRLRGLLSPPDIGGGSPLATGIPWKAPAPPLSSMLASLRVHVGSSSEWAYWSEDWVSADGVLGALVSNLRAVRPTRRLRIDDGWHPDRDLSLAIGRWGWLHARALVEEREQGRCLVRLHARLQPSAQGIVRALLLAVVLLAGTSAATALRWPSVSMGMALGAIGLVLGAAWQIVRGVSVLERALQRVAALHGMVPVPVSLGRERLAWRPAAALHKGQAAIAAILAVTVTISGVSLYRGLTTPRPGTLPARHVAPRAEPAPTLSNTTATTPTAAARRPARPKAPPRAETVPQDTTPKRRVAKRTA